jgi:hypothetical protein
MESNTYSAQQSPGHPDGRRDGLAELAAAVDELVAQDLDGLPGAVLAERVLCPTATDDRLKGVWLKALAAMDTRDEVVE